MTLVISQEIACEGQTGESLQVAHDTTDGRLLLILREQAKPVAMLVLGKSAWRDLVAAVGTPPAGAACVPRIDRIKAAHLKLSRR